MLQAGYITALAQQQEPADLASVGVASVDVASLKNGFNTFAIYPLDARNTVYFVSMLVIFRFYLIDFVIGV